MRNANPQLQFLQAGWGYCKRPLRTAATPRRGLFPPGPRAARATPRPRPPRLRGACPWCWRGTPGARVSALGNRLFFLIIFLTQTHTAVPQSLRWETAALLEDAFGSGLSKTDTALRNGGVYVVGSFGLDKTQPLYEVTARLSIKKSKGKKTHLNSGGQLCCSRCGFFQNCLPNPFSPLGLPF